jgi:3-deoxy-manno-octulosonate cytidylyltransferase (CMP-KDO synthetase)
VSEVATGRRKVTADVSGERTGVLTDRSRVVAVIPARYGSARLPGKALAMVGRVPMIQHVYERTCRASGIGRTLVATDDERIAAAVRDFGGEVVVTGAHATGTDRVAAVAAELDADVIVDVQGDLPLIDPAALAACVAPFRAGAGLEMTSLMTAIRDEREWRSPHVVKVVTTLDGWALYFSRSPLPYWRVARAGAVLGRRHIGLYAWRRGVLLDLAAAPRSPLERAEDLEQLRALERGVRIKMIEVDSASPEVDTAEDLEQVRRLVGDDG